MEFNKKPLNTAEMVQRLITRGMKIEDINKAENVLNHINYNRLSPYWRTFELDHPNSDHTFRMGANLDRVLRIYTFDGEFRLLLMGEIERIEISLRRGWAGHLSIRYGAFAHQEAHLFGKNWMWAKSLEKLKDDYKRSDESFATYYLENYPDLELPPIWVCTELMTLGSLSKLIENLADPTDRQAVSQAYDLDEVILVSFLHHLVIVRNIVAHHSRIWNRRFVFKFKLPRNQSVGLADFFNLDDGKVNYLYNTLVMLKYLSTKIDSTTTFSKKIVDLFDRYPEILPSAMGFPVNWKEMSVWL